MSLYVFSLSILHFIFIILKQLLTIASYDSYLVYNKLKTDSTLQQHKEEQRLVWLFGYSITKEL